MDWTRKSEQRQMYCAVHNVDCPLHGHSGDPMVLDVSPGLVPGAWICPQAVGEISAFEDQADEYTERNESISALITSEFNDVIIRALELEGAQALASAVREYGTSILEAEDLDYVIAAIEAHQNELGDDGEAVHEQLIEASR